MKTTLITRWLFFFISGLLFFQCKKELPTTLLIKNATIIDGTGSNRFRGSVRIEGHTINAIGDLKPLKTDSVIDANGLVLSPGFIDTHSHHAGDTLRTMEAAMSQGITTIIIGQDGFSNLSLKKFKDSILKEPWSINVGSYTGHNTLREVVMGENFKNEATKAQIEQMKALLEEDMQNGSLGLSTGLEYDPGIYSNTFEVIELAKVASKYGGRYISHMRSEDIDLIKEANLVLDYLDKIDPGTSSSASS